MVGLPCFQGLWRHPGRLVQAEPGAVPRQRRGWKDSLPELPLVLFSAPRTSAASACPPRPVLCLHHYSSSSEQAAPQRNSVTKHTGDAVRTRAPGALLHGRVGGQHPQGLRASGASATSGVPRDSLPASGDSLGAEAGRYRHPARHVLSRLPEAPAMALPDRVSLVGFFALGGCVGRLHRHQRKLPHGNKKQRRL
ncbi:unnamed protein product [Coccothraustes coccothraustes]